MRIYLAVLLVFVLAITGTPANAGMEAEDSAFSNTVGFASDILKNEDVYHTLIVRRSKAGGEPYFLLQGIFNYIGAHRFYQSVANFEGTRFPVDIISHEVVSCRFVKGCYQQEKFSVRFSAAEMTGLVHDQQIQLMAYARSGKRTMITIPGPVALEILQAGILLCPEC